MNLRSSGTPSPQTLLAAYEHDVNITQAAITNTYPVTRGMCLTTQFRFAFSTPSALFFLSVISLSIPQINIFPFSLSPFLFLA